MDIPKLKLTPEQMKVIARIQNSIPKMWLENVTHKEPIAPVIKQTIELALADPEVSEEMKAKCLMIKNSGELDKEVDVEDPKYTKLIDDYVDREIKKAVKRGELPRKMNVKKLIKKNDNKNK